MGLPKVFRSPLYSIASSNAARAIPIACAAIPIRPPSRVLMATRKPSPSLPSRFLAGTRQSSKKMEHECAALMPWCVGGHQKGGDSPVAGRAIGHREEQYRIRFRSVGNPVLRAIDHVLVAFSDGGRLLR